MVDNSGVVEMVDNSGVLKLSYNSGVVIAEVWKSTFEVFSIYTYKIIS